MEYDAVLGLATLISQADAERRSPIRENEACIPPTPQCEKVSSDNKVRRIKMIPFMSLNRI